MRSLSLFTGYGGLDLALEGYATPIGYCEIERYAQGIIASRIADGSLPNAPIYPDVTKLRGERGACDIIVGGFPCQDISVAGNGKGLGGKRSGLFFEVVRLTREIQPAFVFLENVPAIRTRGLRAVVRAFTDVGYDCRWARVSAESVGAPHKRERWFMVAYANKNRLKQSLPLCARNKKSSLQPRRFGERKLVAEKILDTASARLERWLEPQAAWTTLAECASADQYFGIQGLPEPAILRDADGFAHRVDRIKALGNGVVPAQARKAFEALIGVA